MYDIKKRVQETHNEELDKKDGDINCLPGHAQMFKAIIRLPRQRSAVIQYEMFWREPE